MKRPVTDYRGLRLNNLNTPAYSHLLLLLGWVVYFLLYFLTENLIPAEQCHVIWCPLDDVVPFCEYFLIPYVFWYVWIVASLVYFALYDTGSFRSMSKYIIVTQAVAMLVYILYPSRQDLRPETFATDNLLTRTVAFLYAFDTNTGVCPSLHVAYSVGIASAWVHRKESAVLTKISMILLAILISLSTAFIKQHSVVDIFAAIPVCVLAEWLVFYGPWKNRVQSKEE